MQAASAHEQDLYKGNMERQAESVIEPKRQSANPASQYQACRAIKTRHLLLDAQSALTHAHHSS